jgi:hypothetical protein
MAHRDRTVSVGHDFEAEVDVVAREFGDDLEAVLLDVALRHQQLIVEHKQAHLRENNNQKEIEHRR